MSNKLKCPFCGQELKQDYYDCIMFECHNPKCKHYYDSCVGREELWQELINTRKVLDKAIWWLNEIVENHRYTPISTAEKALAEIKALIKGGK